VNRPRRATERYAEIGGQVREPGVELKPANNYVRDLYIYKDIEEIELYNPHVMLLAHERYIKAYYETKFYAIHLLSKIFKFFLN
jgi:hypothetical protein